MSGRGPGVTERVNDRRADSGVRRHRYTCRSYGFRLAVETDSSAKLDELIRWLPPHAPCDDVELDAVLHVLWPGENPDTLQLDINGVPAASASPLRGLHRFESQAKLLVAEHSPDFVFVHAGVVGWRGRAIVIPGRSFTGKTTLVSSLIAAGAEYASDEYAVVDAQGQIHPFPRPLMVRRHGERHWCEPGDWGARQVAHTLPAGLVLIAHYDPAASWSPAAVSPGPAVLQLFANTVSARRDPARALAHIRQLMTTARGWSSPRGAADSTATQILDAFDQLTSQTESDNHASQTTNQRVTC